MNLDRRFLLKLLSTLPLVACKEHSAPNAQDHKMTPVEMPPEEFKLLEESKTRTSTDKPLVIQSRLLGTPHRLDGGELANVEFVDCDFLGHFMFNVNLTNVTFTRCAIVGVRWEDGTWRNVSFVDCTAQGKDNNIVPGAGTGPIRFRDCKFLGDPPKSSQDQESLENYGGVGSAGQTSFTNCTFERMNVRIIGSAVFDDCRFASVGIDSSRPQVPIDSITLQRCSGKYAMDLSNKGVNSLTISGGTFERVAMTHCNSRAIRLESTQGDFDFSVTTSDSFVASGCTFKSSLSNFDQTWAGGLTTTFSRIGSLTLTDCRFKGENAKWRSRGEPAKLDSHGKPAPRFTGEGDPLPYSSEWVDVAIKKTPIAGADWRFARIKKLMISDGAFKDNTLASCDIGRLELSNVTLEGTLDFSGAHVSEFHADQLTRKDLNLIKDKSTKFEFAAAGRAGDDDSYSRWFT